VRRVAAGAALAAAGALCAAPALAGQTITAGPTPNSFANPEVTIDQGQVVTFQNSDPTGVFHDVTSDQNGPRGTAMFQSATIERSKTAPVKGVEFLKTGDYGFHCSVHPFMKGTLHVSAAGTPKTPTPDNPWPGSTDTKPPVASVAIRDSRISGVLEHEGVRVRLKANEPARFNLTASSGKTTIAAGIVTVKGATRRAKLALTRKGKQLLFMANSVRLRLSAKVNDAGDNRSGATATRRLL
jgi:plastocyanin